jgi:hypothetical protein
MYWEIGRDGIGACLCRRWRKCLRPAAGSSTGGPEIGLQANVNKTKYTVPIMIPDIAINRLWNQFKTRLCFFACRWVVCVCVCVCVEAKRRTNLTHDLTGRCHKWQCFSRYCSAEFSDKSCLYIITNIIVVMGLLSKQSVEIFLRLRFQGALKGCDV